MSKTTKILLSVSIFIIVLFGGLFFYASTKINPEEIRKMAILGIEKSMPGTKVNLGKIDYSLGLNVKIEFYDLGIQLKDSNNDFIKVGDFHLKVPIWAIITNGGTIELVVNKPLLNYEQYSEKENSFSKAFGPKTEAVVENKKEDAGKPADGELKIPAFISKSKVNVKVEDTNVNYKLVDKTGGHIVVNRLLLKNLNLESTTAFEVETDIYAELKDKKKFNSHALVIGQINLKEYIEHKKIDTQVMIDVTKLSMTGLNYKIPEIKTNLKVLMLENGTIYLDLDSNVGSLATTNLKVEMQDKKIDLKTFKLDLFLKELSSFLDQETADKLSKIDFNGATFSVAGELALNDGAITNSNINFGLNKDITVKGDEGLNIQTIFKGKYQNENLSASLSNKVLDGNLSVDVKGKLNPLMKDFSIEKLGLITVDVLASGIKFSPEMIRKNLYANKPKQETQAKTADETATKKVVHPPRTARKLPNVLVNLNWKQITIGRDDFNGNGKILVQGSSIASEGINFQFSKGKGKISFSNKQKDDLLAETNFSFNLAGLNLNSLQPFLPPMLENIKGDFSGDVKGNLSENKDYTNSYSVNFNLNASNGMIAGLNLTEHIAGVIGKVDMLKDKLGKKDFKVTDEFEKLIVKGDATDKQLNLSVFDFVGVKNSTSVTGKGNVGMPLSKRDSQLELVYQDKTGAVSTLMTKNIGTDKLPLKLVGLEFALKPDYGYTLSAIAKGAIKTKGKEIVKKEAEKVLDKVLKNDDVKEKAGKLLKGLFR